MNIIISINLSGLREEIENETFNFLEINIYYKANTKKNLKNLKNYNRGQSKNLESTIIFPAESPSTEIKKEHKKVNSANTKKKHRKNYSNKRYLKYSSEFMMIVQTMKLDNK